MEAKVIYDDALEKEKEKEKEKENERRFESWIINLTPAIVEDYAICFRELRWLTVPINTPGSRTSLGLDLPDDRVLIPICTFRFENYDDNQLASNKRFQELLSYRLGLYGYEFFQFKHSIEQGGEQYIFNCVIFDREVFDDLRKTKK